MTKGTEEITPKMVLDIFNLDDADFEKAILELPVADVNAISSELISGPAFEFFVNYMQLIIAYETKIQEHILIIYNLLLRYKPTNINNTEYNNTNTISLKTKTQNTIKYHILAHNFFKYQLKKKRTALREGKFKEWKMSKLDMDKIWQKVDTNIVLGFEFLTSKMEYPLTIKDIDTILGYLQVEINKSKDRISRNRRSEFRKALTMNYNVVFQNFLDNGAETYELHDSKLDRVVMDIYCPDLMTHDPLLKAHLNKMQRKLKLEHDINEIPTLDFIEALKSVYKYEHGDIDDLVEEFENERKKKLMLGYERRGLLISQTDFGKLIFTYNPESSGAPIRLRIITNVQDNVRDSLFTDYPEKKDIYKQRTWAGTEINFILPEDYDYYQTKEFSFCSWLEWNSKYLFMDYVEEYLGIEVKFERLVAYVSQVEVCYEEEFHRRRRSAKLYQDNCKNPSLFEFIHKKQAYFHKYSHAYCNSKYDGKTHRPSLHMDMFSINPEFSLMQYKVYPKYYLANKKIALRNEFIPTRFIKYLTLDGDDLPISQKVLSNPAYVREIIERLFQFELKHNGVRGYGYNKRFKKQWKPDHEELSNSLLGKIIFGRNADQYEIELEKIKGGRIAKTVPIYYRQKMVEMGIATKIKRGAYTTTGNFNEILKKLFPAR